MNDSENAGIGQWCLRLFAWDGLLPVTIWAVAIILNGLFPRRDLLISLTALLFPIAAFWIRYVVGMRYLRNNNCGPIMRFFQKLVFTLAILGLVIFDFMMISQFANAPGAAMDLKTLVVPYSIYLSAMAFALYPGFRHRSDTGSEYELMPTTRWNAFGGEENV